MKLKLIRIYYPTGTNGTLLLNGVPVCATIELPWKNNQPRISCIPEGNYRLTKRYSPHFQWHFQLMEVPGRQWILVHPANDALAELEGCIAPVSFLNGIGKGSLSRQALSKLKTLLFPLLENGDKLFITIKANQNETDHHPDEKTNTGIL